MGLPIARGGAIVSLATTMVMDLVLGPQKEKQTGETALLRQMMKSFAAGDVVVFDCYYCSFLMIALLQQQQVDVCARLHQNRHADFRKGRRLGKAEHMIVWTRPARAWWMRNQFSKIRWLTIYLDNGPKNSGTPTQFLKRMIEFADWSGLEIHLVYYAPYHGLYNRPMCLGPCAAIPAR